MTRTSPFNGVPSSVPQSRPRKPSSPRAIAPAAAPPRAVPDRSAIRVLSASIQSKGNRYPLDGAATQIDVPVFRFHLSLCAAGNGERTSRKSHHGARANLWRAHSLRPLHAAENSSPYGLRRRSCSEQTWRKPGTQSYGATAKQSQCQPSRQHILTRAVRTLAAFSIGIRLIGPQRSARWAQEASLVTKLPFTRSRR
jgi:hypothetical protein